MLRRETEADCNFRRDVRNWLGRNLDPSLQDLPGRPGACGDARMVPEAARAGLSDPPLAARSWRLEMPLVRQLILYEERTGAPDTPTE